MADPLDARSLLSGVDPAVLPSLPQRVLPRMTFAMVNGQMVPTDEGPETPDAPDAPSPAAPLATSRDEVDPAQLGALIARLTHAASSKGPLTPPQQSSQPVLSPAAASLQIPPTPAVSHAQVPVAHIGAPVVGERYVPPTFPQIMTSANPAQGLAENFLGPSRPRAVQVADPYGAEAWLKGAGQPPLMLGTTENVGESALGRGLYSRVDDVAASLPERGLHPNKVASLLKSGASQEEVAYRKVPEFLAGKGNQPVTRAELQAHLQANPAPFPQTTVLGGPNPARPTTLPAGYRIEPMEQSGFNRFTLVGPDQTGRILHARSSGDALDEAISWISNGESRTLPTKFSSYSLPGGEQYREHLLQLPDPIAAQRAALQQQMDAKVAEIQATPKIADLNISTPEEYYAHPAYARAQQVIAEHNALNDQLRALPPAPTPYSSGHFDQPNVLAHVRTTERTLPGAPPPEPPAPTPQLTGADLHQQGWTVRVDREDPYTGSRQMTLINPQGEWSGSRGMTRLTPEEYLHDQALDLNRQAQTDAQAQAAQPTGPRGRFLEEVQSDWHQQGKRQGYQGPPSPASQARIAQLPDAITAAQREMADLNQQQRQASGVYQDRLREETIPRLPPEWAHLTSLSEALGNGEAATNAWRQARTAATSQSNALRDLRAAEAAIEPQLNAAAARVTTLQEELGRLRQPTGVPDSPYKEAWPDLALKQQLLDVARDPHANWLGFTGGKTQAARYDLSKQVSQLSFEPAGPGDYSMGDLVALDHQGDEVIRQRVTPAELDDHIGKEPANALRQRIADRQQAEEWDRSQWSIEPHESGNGFVIHDPNGELVHRWGGDVDWFNRQEDAQRYIDEAVHESTRESPPLISGLDLQVGGEGMTHFYDNLLPARLRKLVKPFGGTVEPFDLPASKEGFRIVNQHGESMGRYDSLANAQASLPIAQREYSSYQLHIEPPPH